MSNSPLVNYTKISPNKSTRTGKISKITIHHMAGNLSVESCGNVFASSSRQASSNYGVGTDGRIGLYVPEDYRAWTSSNKANDNIAITIEVANNGGESSNWSVSNKALQATIDLCVDICKRNGIERLNYTGDKNGNLTRHNMFAATVCPGPYLQAKFPYIAEEVNKRLTLTTSTTNKELTTEDGELYRVRKNWDDAKGQLGAFKNLSYAIGVAKANEGYKVFSKDGSCVYPSISLAVGDKVLLKEGATYYNGQAIPKWLFGTTLYVRSIGVNSNRVVVSTLKSGAITGAVHKDYLEKQSK